MRRPTADHQTSASAPGRDAKGKSKSVQRLDSREVDPNHRWVPPASSAPALGERLDVLKAEATERRTRFQPGTAGLAQSTRSTSSRTSTASGSDAASGGSLAPLPGRSGCPDRVRPELPNHRGHAVSWPAERHRNRSRCLGVIPMSPPNLYPATSLPVPRATVHVETIFFTQHRLERHRAYDGPRADHHQPRRAPLRPRDACSGR
jgi:hypothetical protein